MTDAWTAKLDTYLDGELSSQEMLELDAHLKTCTGCATEVLHRLQLKRAVKSAGHRFQPRPELRQKVQQRIAGPRTSPWRIWSVAAAVLASLLLAGWMTTYFSRMRMLEAQTYGEIADLHIADMASANPIDVVSSDRHTVKPWFQGKIPFTFNLPELQNSNFTLAGGRVTYLEQAPGAHLIYQVRKHQISVFIFQERALDRKLPSNLGPAKDRSFNFATWSESGLRYFVIGDAGPEDIGKLSGLLKTAAGS
jgi:anti-sigma factor RsiW